jgi:hypothetical protein
MSWHFGCSDPNSWNGEDRTPVSSCLVPTQWLPVSSSNCHAESERGHIIKQGTSAGIYSITPHAHSSIMAHRSALALADELSVRQSSYIFRYLYDTCIIYRGAVRVRPADRERHKIIFLTTIHVCIYKLFDAIPDAAPQKTWTLLHLAPSHR